MNDIKIILRTGPWRVTLAASLPHASSCLTWEKRVVWKKKIDGGFDFPVQVTDVRLYRLKFINLSLSRIKDARERFFVWAEPISTVMRTLWRGADLHQGIWCVIIVAADDQLPHTQLCVSRPSGHRSRLRQAAPVSASESIEEREVQTDYLHTQSCITVSVGFLYWIVNRWMGESMMGCPCNCFFVLFQHWILENMHLTT